MREDCLEGVLGNERYRAPEIVARNMAEGRTGLRTQRGFLDYGALDVPAYQRERLGAFVGQLRHMGLAREPDLS